METNDFIGKVEGDSIGLLTFIIEKDNEHITGDNITKEMISYEMNDKRWHLSDIIYIKIEKGKFKFTLHVMENEHSVELIDHLKSKKYKIFDIELVAYPDNDKTPS